MSAMIVVEVLVEVIHSGSNAGRSDTRDDTSGDGNADVNNSDGGGPLKSFIFAAPKNMSTSF